VATHVDYTIAAKNGTFLGLTTVPAKPGEVITLWVTGCGPTNASVPAGQERTVQAPPKRTPVSMGRCSSLFVAGSERPWQPDRAIRIRIRPDKPIQSEASLDTAAGENRKTLAGCRSLFHTEKALRRFELIGIRSE